MPWSARKSRKLATQTSLTLSLIAGITINLVTSWFQQYILSNPLVLICVIIVLIYLGYWVIIKIRSALLTFAFVVLVLSVFFNLFSSWFQENMLHNLFTTLNVTLFLSFTIIVLVLSYFIGSHPISRGKTKLRRLYKNNARNKVRLAQEGRVNTRRRGQTGRQKKRRS